MQVRQSRTEQIMRIWIERENIRLNYREICMRRCKNNNGKMLMTKTTEQKKTKIETKWASSIRSFFLWKFYCCCYCEDRFIFLLWMCMSHACMYACDIFSTKKKKTKWFVHMNWFNNSMNLDKLWKHSMHWYSNLDFFFHYLLFSFFFCVHSLPYPLIRLTDKDRFSMENYYAHFFPLHFWIGIYHGESFHILCGCFRLIFFFIFWDW